MHSKAGDFWKKRIRNLTSHHSTLLANIFYQENVQPVPSFVASRESLNQHQDSVVRNHKLLMLPLIVSNGKLWIVVSDRYKPGKCVKPGSRKNILLDETFYYPPDS
ncbi:MAG TPA: hypothetical protein EYQ50_24125 [Verrucomicrobiales bacterium]|nr:hypothetical protein [Verrucomicrobiales bacterium]